MINEMRYKLGGKLMKISSEIALICSELVQLLFHCIILIAAREAESKSCPAYK